MYSNAVLASCLAVVSLATAATISVPRDYPTSGPARAVYFLSNNPDHNTVHALPVGRDGTLSHGRVTSTGGKGSRAPAAMLTDALNSQGALQRIGNRLLAVNAGSNTLSMFAIDERDPLNIQLMGEPIDTLGDFPNTIAVSDKVKDVACVANSGTKSGIACFKMGDKGLISMDKTLRPLPLDPTQTTPPQGPFNTVSQIFFNVDGSALWATVKGNPTNKTEHNNGYFGAFGVSNGVVSHQLTQSSPAGTAVLFGSVPLPNNKVFTTDASFGVAVLQVSSAGIASTMHKYTIPSNAATCWATISPATGLAYITDDGANHVVAFDPETAAPKATTNLTNGNPAMIEIVPWGSMLYALSHGNSTVAPAVVVMQTEGASGAVKAVQNFRPYGVNDNVEGMAVYG